MNTKAEACYAAMERLGVAMANGHFSGGNDEGGYDEIVFEAVEGKTLPAVLTDSRFYIYDHISSSGQMYKDGKWVDIPQETPNADITAICDHMYAVLDGEYGSFAGEFSVYGDVIVNSVERTTKMVGAEWGYDDFEAEF